MTLCRRIVLLLLPGSFANLTNLFNFCLKVSLDLDSSPRKAKIRLITCNDDFDVGHGNINILDHIKKILSSLTYFLFILRVNNEHDSSCLRQIALSELLTIVVVARHINDLDVLDVILTADSHLNLMGGVRLN